MATLDYGVPLDRPTIASVFRDLGYHTKLVGKWHLGAPPQHGPLQHGYHEFLGLLEGAGDYFRHRIVVDGKDFGSGLVQGDDPIERAGYLTDLFGDEAVRAIETARNGQPLFLSLHFNAPHWPWEGPEDRTISDGLEDIFHRDGGNLVTYKKMVEAMDANVAKVLAALDRMGMRDNTIVVFTSDNGGERFSDTWPFVGVKGELLEGGIRVPILMQWPGKIAPGSRSEQVMTSMDFLPTLRAMAGKRIGVSEHFDGADLSKQLIQGETVRRTVFWRFKANEQAAVRSGDWKYLKLAGREYLFDLSQDERERANLLHRFPERASDLRRAFDTWNSEMMPYPLASYSEDVSTGYVDRY